MWLENGFVLHLLLKMMYVVNCDIMMGHNDLYVGWTRNHELTGICYVT